MSVYDLYQSYLNQISDVNQNQTPGITDPNYLLYLQQQQGQGGGGENDNNNDFTDGRVTNNAGINSFSDLTGITGIGRIGNIASFMMGGIPGVIGNNIIGAGITGINNLYNNFKNPYTNIMGNLNQQTRDAIDSQGRDSAPGRGDAGNPGGSSGAMDDSNAGTYCFDPSTPIQMADGSTKKIKNIQLGDDTKGGEVTGVFQFKASDEIHDYKGVTVAGSHYVKEDGRFIMVKDSPIAVKIDKIPVVYSLDTSGRRIFINNIEFADYNGDGVAKNFLTNAGVDLTGFDKEVLRQVENRIL
jgi:hypothetical protein